jgi:hypothetical protein
MPHVLQVLFLSVFILQVVMHGEESQVPKFESSRRFTIIQTVQYLVHLTVPIELFWIKELGTAMHYGCNDNIKGVGNLSSPGYLGEKGSTPPLSSPKSLRSLR